MAVETLRVVMAKEEHETARYMEAIPDGLRNPLIAAFNEIVRNFRERRWEPSELNGGKLCEVVYTIIRGKIDGTYPTKPGKPRNMISSCEALESENHRFGRPLCIQIPRMLVALYEVRNNRGVGHVGGDVDPNHMDAMLVLNMAKWLMAELIRIFHEVATAEATQAVEILIERTVPLVWRVAGKSRVLNPTLTMKKKVLALLSDTSGPLAETKLFESTEHSNPTVFRRDVLLPLHREKLIEYDKDTREVHLSPIGIRFVEDQIPLQI
jgi:hypothetical protein